MFDEVSPTWSHRRADDLVRWTDEHLASLAALQLRDLDDPAVIRTIATRARDLAECAERLEALRGHDAEVERAVALLRAQLRHL
ncbi:hypothetical protein [Conexibacter sp. SYSU D00693]|uniref:hypothetical protein n=1 Tax=Conexibacter sp. SYSU D00693 TaxID=2812560 RepID=UPI00196A8EDB|nr:hypothetical protein [Conexibacter sp. SYSU D00693]